GVPHRTRGQGVHWNQRLELQALVKRGVLSEGSQAFRVAEVLCAALRYRRDQQQLLPASERSCVPKLAYSSSTSFCFCGQSQPLSNPYQAIERSTGTSGLVFFARPTSEGASRTNPFSVAAGVQDRSRPA